MILTITLNPCVDKSSVVDTIVPDKKLRCKKSKYEPGGGGINVSRALKRLSSPAKTFFVSGGRTGKLLEELLEKEGVDIFTFQTEKETRENFIVVNQSNNQQYRFGFPGEPLSETEQNGILSHLADLEDFPEITVVSGSLPEAVSDSFFKKLILLCKEKNSKVVIDTSGPALQIAAEAGVYLLKPNIGELAKLTGKEELSGTEVDRAAFSLIKNGSAELVVVSLGPLGASLYSSNGKIHQTAPLVKVKSTVGAGDSMVAGMVSVLAKNGSESEILRMGVACGSATTMTEGTGLFSVENLNSLLKELPQK